MFGWHLLGHLPEPDEQHVDLAPLRRGQPALELSTGTLGRFGVNPSEHVEHAVHVRVHLRRYAHHHTGSGSIKFTVRRLERQRRCLVDVWTSTNEATEQ